MQKDSETISLKKIIVDYLYHWKVFLVAACISLVCAILYMVIYPQTYEFVARIKIQEDKKKLLIVGRLSNNIVKKFPNFLIVNIAIDDQLMENLKIELSKNYFAVFILKYQTNTIIQRKIKRNQGVESLKFV